jgi:hypothetical protein
MIADLGRFPETGVARCWATAGTRIVREYDSPPDVHVVAQTDAFADKAVGSDAAVTPDIHALLDFDERANIRIVADRTAVQVDRSGDSHIGSEGHIDDADAAQIGRARVPVSNAVIVHEIYPLRPIQPAAPIAANCADDINPIWVVVKSAI